MDANDTRHFPLTFRIYRMCQIIVTGLFAVGSPGKIVYGDHPMVHRVMADLVAELGEADQYDTDGGARFGALLFAFRAMQAYFPDPRTLGFHMPMA
ncbi:hypothetical protein [Streptomyces tsukubensis]|uniref:hypothetical protein n=1 Tax=Streptomyces tsukubensis TaxID=83656 RepID=UPI00344FD659